MPATKRSPLCGHNAPERYTDIQRELRTLQTPCGLLRLDSSTLPALQRPKSSLDNLERVLAFVNDPHSNTSVTWDDDDCADGSSLYFSGCVEYKRDTRRYVADHIRESIWNGSLDPDEAIFRWAYDFAATKKKKFIWDKDGDLTNDNFGGISVSKLRSLRRDTLPSAQVLYGTAPIAVKRVLPRAISRSTFPRVKRRPVPAWDHKLSAESTESSNTDETDRSILPSLEANSGESTDGDAGDLLECPRTPVVPSQDIPDCVLYASTEAFTSRLDLLQQQVDWNAPVFSTDEDDEPEPIWTRLVTKKERRE